MSKITLRQWVLITLLAAFFMRLPGMLAAMTYDEIWTITQFTESGSWRLLFDLELPNNHPLNSILCKILYTEQLPKEACRVPSLLAGLISIVLAGAISRKFWGSKAMLWSMFFMAFSAPLAYYSTQARGYSLQTCFLLLYTYTLILTAEEKKSVFACILTVFSAAAAIITLSTSAIFLAAITLFLWGGNNWKMPDKKTTCVLIASIIIPAGYLLLNLSALLTARQWGVEISGIKDAVFWLGSIFFNLLPPALLPWAVTGVIVLRKYKYSFLASIFLLAAVTIVTNPGPWRIYLPLAAFGAIIAARGAVFLQEKFSGKRWFMPAAMLAAAAVIGNGYILYNGFQSMDYYRVGAEAIDLPPETLVVYPPEETYPLYFNNGETFLKKYIGSLHNKANNRTLLLVDMPENMISGTDRSFAPRSLPLPFAGNAASCGGSPARELRLQKLQNFTGISNDLIVIINAENYAEFKRLSKNMQTLLPAEKVLFLNLWFTSRNTPCGVFYTAAGAFTGSSFEKILAADSDCMVFYQIVR